MACVHVGGGGIDMGRGNDYPSAALVWLTRRWSPRSFGDPTMDKNRMAGAGKEIKGATKEALGKVTGDKTQQAAGFAEKKIGTAQRKAGEAIDRAKH
jgi:uncharacterized protein YjbJ (UPF0337 family)